MNKLGYAQSLEYINSFFECIDVKSCYFVEFVEREARNCGIVEIPNKQSGSESLLNFSLSTHFTKVRVSYSYFEFSEITHCLSLKLNKKGKRLVDCQDCLFPYHITINNEDSNFV